MDKPDFIQIKNVCSLKDTVGTSLGVQGLRICLPTQGTWVWSLVEKLRYTYCGVTKHTHHNQEKPTTATTEPMHSRARAPHLEEPARHREGPAWPEKDTVRECKDQATHWEETLASHTANKSLVFWIDQECSKLALKKPTQFFFKKGQNIWTYTSPKTRGWQISTWKDAQH